MAEKSLSITLPLPVPLLTINQRQKMHWRARADATRVQREMAGWHARHGLPEDFAPFVGTVRLDVQVHPHPRQKEPDYGGKWQAVKPWEDGLQDAGLFAGGDDKVVVHGAFVWDKTKRTGEVTLTLSEVQP